MERGILPEVNSKMWNAALVEEGERVEWKESANDVDGILRAACALGNDLGDSGQPGYLVIGLDKKGRPISQDTSDEAIQSLTSRLRSTKILPNPSCSVESAPHQDKTIVIVSVAPYPVPPIITVDGVAYVRVGNTTRRATSADLARLSERRPENLKPFDLRACPPATISDLDERKLRDEYAASIELDRSPETFPPFEAWLGQRNLLKKTSGGQWLATPAGLLVYGLDPQSHLPGAIVEFVRYGGTEFDAPVVSRKPISGRITDQLDALWAQIQANVAEVPSSVDGIRHPFHSEFPVDALKELARNLVQHRLYEGTSAPGRVSWFDDKIIFNNPGGPYGQASEGAFGDHSDYRNPSITRLLAELGYVERLGRGIRLAQSLLSKNGNPPMAIETDRFTTVTVRRRS